MIHGYEKFLERNITMKLLQSKSLEKKRAMKWLEKNIDINIIMKLLDIAEESKKEWQLDLFGLNINPNDLIFTKEEIKKLFRENSFKYGELAAIRLWDEKIITDEEFCKSFSDLDVHNGRIFLSFRSFWGLQDLVDDYALRLLEGEDESDYYSNEHYNVRDMWQYVNKNNMIRILNYCISKNIKVEINNVPITLRRSNLVFRYGKLCVVIDEDIENGYKAGFIGESTDNQFDFDDVLNENKDDEFVDFDDVLNENKDDELNDLYNVLRYAMFDANEYATYSGFYKHAKNAVIDQFGKWEWTDRMLCFPCPDFDEIKEALEEECLSMSDEIDYSDEMHGSVTDIWKELGMKSVYPNWDYVSKDSISEEFFNERFDERMYDV